MTTRLLTLAAVLALSATACSSAPTADVNFGEGERFLQYVADSQDDVGLGPSVAVDGEGLPTISYFGFPEELEEGEVPQPRPIGAPFLPGVLVTSATAEGMFSRGAVVTNEPDSVPVGVAPPYGPVLVPDLPLTVANANGTASAIAEDGTVHVAWTGGEGVSHASVAYQEEAVVTPIYQPETAIQRAGPVGRPGIVIDDLAVPWVAFSADSAEGIDVMVARPDGDRWVTETVATASRCDGCPGPLPTGIAFAGGAPIVVFVDPGMQAVRAARLTGDTWTVNTVESGVTGDGLAVVSDGERALASYYTGDGGVHVAVWRGSWSTTEVAPTQEPAAASGAEAPATSVAVAEDLVYVTWQDGAAIRLADGDGAAFEAVEIGEVTGAHPSVVATAAGAFLAWYDASQGNLMLGVWGDPAEVLLANPSPAPTISIAPEAPSGCGDDGEIDLVISGSGSTFDKNCLVGPAQEPFTITFNNQDGQHNLELLDVAPSEGGEVFAATDVATGPIEQPLDVDPLDPADYYFQCQIHPTSMFGTLAVVEGAR